MSSQHGRPTTARVAAVLLALAGAGAAQADETFLFRVSGGGFHLFDAWECPMQFCTVGGTSFSWEGTVSVMVDTAASGTYAPPHFVSIAMAWTTPYVAIPFQTDPARMSGPVPTVTLSNGQVTSLDLIPIFGTPDTLSFSGLSVGYDKPPTHHSGMTHATAVLIAVPEPASGLLIGVGLAWLPVAARRRRRATIAACTSTSSTCASSSTLPTRRA